MPKLKNKKTGKIALLVKKDRDKKIPGIKKSKYPARA